MTQLFAHFRMCQAARRECGDGKWGPDDGATATAWVAYQNLGEFYCDQIVTILRYFKCVINYQCKSVKRTWDRRIVSLASMSVASMSYLRLEMFSLYLDWHCPRRSSQ